MDAGWRPAGPAIGGCLMDEHRQLAAIMFTDIVGYTALMSGSESAALKALKRNRRLLQRLARRCGGRWLESIGDGDLVSFGSATDAVGCALSLQHTLEQTEDFKLRIGIHVGDVIDAGGHLYGDGVNVASRIQALAEPGGIVVSETVYDAVRNKDGIQVEKLGVRELKNLDHPIQVYSVSGEGVDVPTLGEIDQPARRRSLLAAALLTVLAVVVAAIGLQSRNAGVGRNSVTIAVLPFDNLSNDPANAYFSDGVSEEILDGLAKVPGLNVVGRSASFAYRDKSEEPRKIGQELDATHLVEGTVRRAGNSVRISAQLIDASNGYQVWADSYEAEMNDIFSVQANIGKSIVEALSLKLMPDELAGVGDVGTRDPKAYDLYLQGRAELNKATTAAGYEAARALLDDALKRDPMFAEAEAGKCEALVWQYKISRDSSLLDPARTTCNRARNRDPDSVRVQIALGVLYSTTGQPELAVQAAQRAVELDPDSADAHRTLGAVYADAHDLDKAKPEFEHAIELAPKDPNTYRAYAYALYQGGQFSEAADMYGKQLVLDPGNAAVMSNLSAMLYYSGRFKEAAQLSLDAIRRSPSAAAYSNAGTNLYFAGEYSRAVEMYRHALDLGSGGDFRLYGNLAGACRFDADCSGWQEMYRQAITQADDRLRVNPEDAVATAYKGVYLMWLGDVKQGGRLIGDALQAAPDDVDVLACAAIYWSKVGDKSKAREYADKARAAGYPVDHDPDIVVASNK